MATRLQSWSAEPEATVPPASLCLGQDPEFKDFDQSVIKDDLIDDSNRWQARDHRCRIEPQRLIPFQHSTFLMCVDSEGRINMVDATAEMSAFVVRRGQPPVEEFGLRFVFPNYGESRGYSASPVRV